MQRQPQNKEPLFGWLMMSGAGTFIGSVSFFDHVSLMLASLQHVATQQSVDKMGTSDQHSLLAAEERISLSHMETVTESIPVEVNQEVEEGPCW